MQPSGTTKDVPARMNRLSGIKTRLNLDPNHAGPMMEKTKVNWEHFYNNLFTIKRGKICGTGNRFIGCVMQGKERSVVRQFTATYKRRHRPDLRGNKTGKIYNDQIKTLMQFYLKTVPHTQMHTDTNKPRNMAKDPLVS